MKKIFVFVFLAVLMIGTVQANIIATIGEDGLSFLQPSFQDIVQGVLCVSGPVGALTCVEQYVEGKIIGYISGKVMEEISKASPEVYNAIVTYNQVKGYIDKGASILEELRINPEGEVEKGSISFDEEEYSIKELFVNLTAEDVVLSNVDYSFENKTITFRENGFLKLQVEDEEGNIQELSYENVKEGGIFKLNENGLIEEADFFSSNDSIYKFGEYEQISVDADTHIEYKDGILRVYGEEKDFLYGDTNISLVKDFIDFSGNQVICFDCVVGDVELRGVEGEGILSIMDNGYLIEKGQANYKQNLFNVVYDSEKILLADENADLSDYGGNWLRQTSDVLEIQSAEGDGRVNIEFLEDHDILNTDDKDNLYAYIMQGDGLRVEKRLEEGLVPKVVHKSSEEGETSVSNGAIDFSLSKEKIKLSPVLTIVSPSPIKSESIAFEIESDSPEINNKLRINSYNQFVLLSEEDEELVKYNKYDLPVSILVQDNSLQTIEQLREKYPKMKFNVPEKTVFGMNFLNEEDSLPYLVYLTDIFLKENPGALDDILEIQFVDSDSAAALMDVFAGTKKVMVAGAALDPYNFPLRGMTSPMQIMVHEYEHIKDMLLEDEEFVYFPEASSSETLQEKYDEIARDALNRLSNDINFKENIQEFYKDAEERYIRELLESEIEKKYKKDIISYIQEDLREEEFLGKTKEDILEEYKNNPAEINGLLLSQLLSLYPPEEKMSNEEWMDSIRLRSLGSYNEVGKEVLMSWDSKNVWKYLKSVYTTEQMNKVDNAVEIYSGMPYSYALKDQYESLPFLDSYLELSSTYREQPIEVRRMKVQSANPLIAETYKKLTQLAFDSGKMEAEEYKIIMGEDYCMSADCFDKLCVEYKLLCCYKNFGSPNC